MDQSVEELHVRTSDASMTLQNTDTFILLPLADNNFTKKAKSVSIEYYFDNRDEIETLNGEIPKWRMPCIQKITTCEFMVGFQFLNFIFQHLQNQMIRTNLGRHNFFIGKKIFLLFILFCGIAIACYPKKDLASQCHRLNGLCTV